MNNNNNKALKPPHGSKGNSLIVKSYLETINNITPVEFDCIIGNCLGDASIQLNNKSTAARIKYEWSSLAYSTEIYNIMNRFIICNIFTNNRINANNNLVTTFTFQTLTSSI